MRLSPRFLSLTLAGAFLSLPLRAESPLLLLDNFDQDKTENALGGATGAWMDPEDKSQGCTVERVQLERVGTQGRSLRIDFDIDSQRETIRIPSQLSVSNPAVVVNQAFNGYYSLLPGKDLRPYSYLIFWAKGDAVLGFSRSFKIELKDGANSAGHVVDGLNSEWRRFVIPLRAFNEIQNWNSIKEFVIVFAADVVTRKVGTFYIDEIYFAQSPDNNTVLPERAGTAPAIQKPVTLDGRVSEWPRRSWTDISSGEHMESGVRGLRDTEARFAVQWDEDNLYLAVVLGDNETLNSEDGEDIWRGDCVEIYLNPSGTDFVWGAPTAFQLGFSPLTKSGPPGRWAWFQRRAPSEEEVRAVWDRRGRTLEVALAWSFLGVRPGINRDLGFSLGFHDKDAKDGTPEAKLQWCFQSLGGKNVRLGKLVLQ